MMKKLLLIIFFLKISIKLNKILLPYNNSDCIY